MFEMVRTEMFIQLLICFLSTSTLVSSNSFQRQKNVILEPSYDYLPRNPYPQTPYDTDFDYYYDADNIIGLKANVKKSVFNNKNNGFLKKYKNTKLLFGLGKNYDNIFLEDQVIGKEKDTDEYQIGNIARVIDRTYDKLTEINEDLKDSDLSSPKMIKVYKNMLQTKVALNQMLRMLTEAIRKNKIKKRRNSLYAKVRKDLELDNWKKHQQSIAWSYYDEDLN